MPAIPGCILAADEWGLLYFFKNCSRCQAGVGIVVFCVDGALNDPCCVSLFPLLWLLLLGLHVLVDAAVPCPGETAP